MSTKTQITQSIDDNVRDKLPLVLKTELADTLQLMTNEQFPNFVKVEWNGTDIIDPTSDVVVSETIDAPTNVRFIFNFWKQGNTVYFNGEITSLRTSSALDALLLIYFNNDLYKPLANSPIKTSMISSYNQQSKVVLLVNSGGISMTAGLPAQVASIYANWTFNGTYKVAN